MIFKKIECRVNSKLRIENLMNVNLKDDETEIICVRNECHLKICWEQQFFTKNEKFVSIWQDTKQL